MCLWKPENSAVHLSETTSLILKLIHSASRPVCHCLPMAEITSTFHDLRPFLMCFVFNYVRTAYCMCVAVCRYMHNGSGSHGDQKRMPALLEVELQAVVSHTAWVLEAKLQASASTVCILNH